MHTDMLLSDYFLLSSPVHSSSSNEPKIVFTFIITSCTAVKEYEKELINDSEMKYGPKGRDIVDPTAATPAPAPAPTPTPATGSRINRLTGRPFGYTPPEMTGPPAPAPMEKTPAQKYAEAQEAYQKGFKTEDDTQNTRFAAMNRIYSGADSQGQADIVAQSLKRAAGLEKTATPAPTKRTSRINRRK